MTVEELIMMLNKLPKDAEVLIKEHDGTECYREPTSITFNVNDNLVDIW